MNRRAARSGTGVIREQYKNSRTSCGARPADSWRALLAASFGAPRVGNAFKRRRATHRGAFLATSKRRASVRSSYSFNSLGVSCAGAQPGILDGPQRDRKRTGGDLSGALREAVTAAPITSLGRFSASEFP